MRLGRVGVLELVERQIAGAHQQLCIGGRHVGVRPVAALARSREKVVIGSPQIAGAQFDIRFAHQRQPTEGRAKRGRRGEIRAGARQ